MFLSTSLPCCVLTIWPYVLGLAIIHLSIRSHFHGPQVRSHVPYPHSATSGSSLGWYLCCFFFLFTSMENIVPETRIMCLLPELSPVGKWMEIISLDSHSAFTTRTRECLRVLFLLRFDTSPPTAFDLVACWVGKLLILSQL